MAEKFEKSIKDWYNNSRTANLEYLDLAENPKIRDYLHTITNNTSVVFDRLCLFSKVSLKHFHEIQQQNEDLKNQILSLKRRITVQDSKIEAFKQPLTKEEVKDLVEEIAQQPKLIEEQALKLTADLEQKLIRVEKLLHEIKNFL
jgi:cell division protein FtsB